MGDTFKLALQLTMIDMFSGAAQVAKRNILAMGEAGKEVGRDFDLMTHHISRGLKSIAVVNFGLEKLKPGVAAAADLQESMIDVRMSLMRSGKDAATLNDELKQVRATAVDLQKITPFSAKDVADVEKELLNSGLDFGKVVGKGATRAAMMLATITKQSPAAAADSMLGVGIPYNLKSDEYSQLADMIQRHVMSGRMKLPDLNTNLKYIAGPAKNVKMPWQDMLTGMAVLGEQGMASNSGIEFKDFITRMTGSSREERRVQAALNQYLTGQGKSPLKFWDQAGKLKPMLTIIKDMRVAFDGMTDEKKAFVLQKIFEQRGALAAIAFMKEGVGSWEYIKDKTEKVASAEAKIIESLKGFNRNVTSLHGTMKTTAASLFEPWLVPLTEITKMANEAVAAIGKFSDAHPKTTATANGLIAAGLATGASYGIYNLVKGGLAGKRVLAGLGGTALGIAEGKIVQAATGVQSVFVTNWPSGLGGSAVVAAVAGAGGAALDVAGGVAIGGALKGVAKKGAGWLAKSALGMAAFELGLPGLMVAGAGAGGYAVGTGINHGIGAIRDWTTGGKYKGTGWAGDEIYDIFNPEKFDMKYATAIENTRSKQAQNQILISLQIDSQGRVISQSNSMSTTAEVTSRRGNFFDALMTSGY